MALSLRFFSFLRLPYKMKIFKEFKKCLVTLITFSSSFPYLIYFKYIKDILIYYVYYILFIEKRAKRIIFSSVSFCVGWLCFVIAPVVHFLKGNAI